MTWKEFKKRVDRQLKEQNISEDSEIWYIDCGTMLRDEYDDSPSVALDEEIGLSISD